MKRTPSIHGYETPFEREDKPKPKTTPVMLAAAVLGLPVDATPAGIEKSERDGQVKFTFDETLPIKMDPGCKETLEKLGFVFGEVTDKIFLQAKFPPGWRKKPTSHSMWSHLLDDKGRERASIFFKAAFYDYDSHMGLSRRYGVKGIFLDSHKQPIYDLWSGEPLKPGQGDREIGKLGFRQNIVIDMADKKVLFESEIVPNPDWDNREEGLARSNKMEEEGKRCQAWLTEHYPDWQSAGAYWD